MQFQTKCVHTGVHKDSTFNSCITPIYPTSTFYWNDLTSHSGFDYTRSGNPTRKALEENIAALEGGISGSATATGMAAIAAVMHLFQPGDHIIAGNDIYGGTYRLFSKEFTRYGISFSFIPMSDPANVKKAITPQTKCIWLETPSNPLLNLVDIAAVTEIAKAHKLITIADNTFLSPYLQRPLALGVDIVLHSTTKYLNGHSDVVGGCIVCSQQEHAERVAAIVNSFGMACSPFDAWLVLRGIKTLGPRMEAHQKGAMALAQYLDAHPKVQKVYYPGLEKHPHHALAKKQQSGFGGMLSFDIVDGRPAAEKFFSRLTMVQLAESLGGIESLTEYPDTMSHASMTLEARRAGGISENTIRVSVGIEHQDDLIADFKHALDD
jgi:cystathionine beta-lyase/cystathionine gamma-synthase